MRAHLLAQQQQLLLLLLLPALLLGCCQAGLQHRDTLPTHTVAVRQPSRASAPLAIASLQVVALVVSSQGPELSDVTTPQSVRLYDDLSTWTGGWAGRQLILLPQAAQATAAGSAVQGWV